MFQYISCYSLSASAERITVLYPKFQYISCYSLSRKGMGYGTSGMRVSIHLMLLFIFATLSDSAVMPMFQYISCYSLSSIHSLCFSGRILFQYISCYSLSRVINGTFGECWMFQYISCYSLSFSRHV